jgi:hypothetical protein
MGPKQRICKIESTFGPNTVKPGILGPKRQKKYRETGHTWANCSNFFRYRSNFFRYRSKILQ